MFSKLSFQLTEPQTIDGSYHDSLARLILTLSDTEGASDMPHQYVVSRPLVGHRNDLGDQILEAYAGVIEAAKELDQHVLSAKRELLSAFKSCEDRNIDVTARHLCLALQALIEELRHAQAH